MSGVLSRSCEPGISSRFCGKANNASSAEVALCSGPRRQNCQDSLGNEQEEVSMISELLRVIFLAQFNVKTR